MTPRPPDGRGGQLPTGPTAAAGDEPGPAAPAAPSGPPGTAIFSLADRPAPGLYFAAWILSLVALGLLLVGFLADSPAASTILLFCGLIVLIVGLSCGAGYQRLARAGRPAGAYRGPSPLVLFAIVVALTIVIVGPLVASGLVGFTTTGGLVQLLVIALGYLLTVWLFVVRTGALSWAEMRRRPTSLPAARLASDVISGVALLAPANVLLSILGGLIALALDVRPTSPLPTPEGALDTVALVLAAVVVAPIGEEIFFRGFALTAWQRDLGMRPALIRSSVFFALVHLANITAETAREGFLLAFVAVVVYLPLGFLLGWLYQRRGLLAAIAGHAASNGTALLLVALASGAAGG